MCWVVKPQVELGDSKTYVHASDEDLQRGQAALARIHKIV